ncbi:MAG: tetratricopeptide repeat protein [Bdellovibrionota bacterium]
MIALPPRLKRRASKHLGLLAALLFFGACNARSPETKYLLAEKLLEDKKYDAAISEFQDIVDKAPSSGLGLEAQLKIAQIQHLYLGRSQEAIESYQEFLKRSKDPNRNREVERTLGDLQFQNFENYDEAITSYSKLVKDSPNSPDAEELVYRLGRAFFLKSQFADAIRVFEYQKAHFPKGELRWKAELEIGNSLSGLGKCNEAMKHFDAVTAEGPKPQQVLARFAKASCFEEQDDLDSAYEIFSQIRDLYPTPAVVDLKMQKIKRRKILRKR